MKKLILSAIAICAFGITSAQDGGFKAGVNFGLPMGDISDTTSFAIGVDVAYMFSVSDQLQVGATVGYATYMAKAVNGDKGDDSAFLRIAATGQYAFTDNIF